MNATPCAECGAAEAPHTTMTGRRLCDACHRRLVGMAGAGAAVAGGGGLGEAMTTGYGAAAYANAVAAEKGAAAGRRAKLAETRGFWRRLWVRVVG